MSSLFALSAGCGWLGVSGSADQLGLAPSVYDIPAADGGRARTITYYKTGDIGKQRIIYVHGTPGNAGVWREYLLDPVPGFETVSLDRPGFGDSDPKHVVTSLAEQARAIEPLLVKQDGKWPILVGHSLGGPIVMRVAAEYPDKVGGVVDLAGALDPALEHVGLAQYIARYFPPALLLPRHVRHSNRELLPLRGELVDLGAELDRITAPVIVIHGTGDRLVDYKNVAYVKRKLVNAVGVETITIPDGDHCVSLYVPKIVREAIVHVAEAPTGWGVADTDPADASTGPDRVVPVVAAHSNRRSGPCVKAYGEK